MHEKLLNKYRYSVILLRELVITDFKLRYQGSALGYLWSLLKPLFLFVIMYFVFVYFLRVGSNIPNWPVSMLLGIVLWNFFSETTSNGLNSVVERGDVIRKINFPKYVIVLASSLSAFINLLINLAVIVVFMLIVGVQISWATLLVPLFILEIAAFGLGLAFILSSLQVRMRDTNYIWEIIMQALFYGSIVLYPASLVIDQNPFIAKIMLLNPIAQSIQDIRHILINEANVSLYSFTHNLWLNLIPLSITIIVVLFGAWYFKKKSPYFAEVV
jgi:ABC-2 type transport system permease protein